MDLSPYQSGSANIPSLQEHGEELSDAALRGDVEEMVRLLNQGADIDAVYEVRFVSRVTCCFDTLYRTHICVACVHVSPTNEDCVTRF